MTTLFDFLPDLTVTPGTLNEMRSFLCSPNHKNIPQNLKMIFSVVRSRCNLLETKIKSSDFQRATFQETSAYCEFVKVLVAREWKMRGPEHGLELLKTV